MSEGATTTAGPVTLDVDALSTRPPGPLAASAWRTVTQEQVDRFAEATGDHQWIHVDPERARSGPFGRTIAHGYLTLSLATALLEEVLQVPDASLIVNYGLNRVRFPAPLPVGTRVRMHGELAGVESVTGGVQATLGLTFEVEGQPKPACVAEILFRYLR